MDNNQLLNRVMVVYALYIGKPTSEICKIFKKNNQALCKHFPSISY